MSDHWTLEDLYTGVVKSWWVLAGTVIVFVVVAAGAWAVLPQTYTATAQHTVEPISVLSSGSSFSTVNMETERLVATSASVLGRAAEGLNGVTVPQLREATVVQVPRGSQVLTFEVTTRSPERSAEWANAVASAYGEMRSENAQDVVEQTTTELSASIEGLQALYDSQPEGSDARAATQLQLDALLEERARLEATPFFPGTLVTPASPPSDSNRPGVLVFVAGGLFLGLMLGGIAALLVTRGRRAPAAASRRDRETAEAAHDGTGVSPEGETPVDQRPERRRPVDQRPKRTRPVNDALPEAGHVDAHHPPVVAKDARV
ncbi:Wzz/FepE/Etk N-terminal domain-containing protein [Microbacterium sp. M3]|uniref:Wzz/FepE/Etk N-terminal domain-containing protein n=1 Tax=Microbacterium arthrosphaerae TaxID=792652 RepID=A0ABU4H2P7_9MICO|nr:MULTISPECIES: Wzz/FepE/Etk N-terminal domain-containing protein [Microbacterium]MDW4573612.1 Wzz/FepE/Etk N-terminal domain-containing protein [Microbacterium arthrosphaerae]MDW7607467.1 Wzz/FepE/Etk N-terminal domain-containing protein [Microbacterium sp. M3]